jgi:plasmid stabilization system protein ParE
MRKLEYHPDIHQELSDAYNWYELKSEGLGEDFLKELDHAFSLIQNTPRTWPVISGKFRRFLLKRFPYGVIYQIKEDCIFILAVMHLSRKPDYWKKRIQ